MTDDRGQYARFYYERFVAEFPAVYADDVAFATWIRLLTITEAMHPLAGYVPKNANKRAIKTLVDARLVTVQPDGTFAVRGYVAERVRRSASARHAAVTRWDQRHADGMRPHENRMAKRDAENMRSTSTSTREGKDTNPVEKADESGRIVDLRGTA